MVEAWWLPALVALVAAMVITAVLVAAGTRIGGLAHPGERSLHDRPMPQLGGLGIVVGVALAAWLLAIDAGPAPLLMVAGAAMPVVAVALVDDLIGLRPLIRVLAHLAAAAALVSEGLFLDAVPYPGGIVQLGPLTAMVVTVLIVGWLINLYNFMDGIDGLAGGMGVIGFGALALLGWNGGAPGFAAAATVVAVAAAGFLLWNFPPARIFMGDIGSTFLGFLVGVFTLWGIRAGVFSVWLPLLVFSPFIVDASATLVRRLARRERVWQAHRSHHYQRLVLAGFSHRQVALGEYLVMVACGLSAVAMQDAGGEVQVGVVVAWLLLYSLMGAWVSRTEKTKKDRKL